MRRVNRLRENGFRLPEAVILGPQEMEQFFSESISRDPRQTFNDMGVCLGVPGISFAYTEMTLAQRFHGRESLLGESGVKSAPTQEHIVAAKQQLKWFEEQVKKMQDETHNFDNGAFIAEYYKKFNQGVRE